MEHKDFEQLQKSDDNLKNLFAKVKDHTDNSNKLPMFYLDNNILLRHYRSPKFAEKDSWRDCHQLVIPTSLRLPLLELAHSAESHLGITKTYQRLLEDFYWPGMKGDIKCFIQSCHACQVTGKPNEKIPVAPLVPITVPSTPFSKIIIDCVGPLPKTSKRNEYLLTILCPTTRFPLAIPIKNIAAKTIIQELTKIFTLFGFPRELQCDQGTNFTSHLFQNTLKQFNINGVYASAYHPQTNGALERIHQTIKSLLRKYINETNKDWDDGMDLLMYILRSVPNESTGIAPFELMFGRKPRTNLSMVKETLLNKSFNDHQASVPQYLNNLKEKLIYMYDFVREHLKVSQDHMKINYDKKAKIRSFQPREKVLVYHPIPGAPLQQRFMGPYEILKRISKPSYVISTPDRRKATQLVHVNLLKPYMAPAQVGHIVCNSVTSDASNAPLEESTIEDDVSDKIIISWKDLNNSDILNSLPQYVEHLSAEQGEELSHLLQAYSSICSDEPGSCTLVEHDVVLELNTQPIRQSFYRVSYHLLPALKAEVDYLLEHNLAKPSASPWASPCILVKKPNNKFRMCTDYRKLNQVTIKDAYPLPRITDIIDSVSNAKFLSQMDLMKGYYQIQLTERARSISAFTTPFGLFEYHVLPFGMTNAPATFQRVMQEVIRGLPNVYVYLDDLVIATDTWEEHLFTLEELFKRLKTANLTINLGKSSFGRGQVKYLGHIVGSGAVMPKDTNIKSIKDFPPPANKKNLKTFLGMVSYYSRFCPNFSIITAPLFALTSNKVIFKWEPKHDRAFNQLKLFMMSKPLLQAPDFSKPFLLQVDASNVGYGGVLLQELTSNNVSSLPLLDRLLPVAYYSGFFRGAQLRWATVEKELYSIVASIQHFRPYLEGLPKVIVYSDHLPLSFLDRAKSTNQKLLRWSYVLSSFNIEVRKISGTKNTFADALSRLPIS